MPKVMQDEANNPNPDPSGTRSFSTSTRRPQVDMHAQSEPGADENANANASDPSVAMVASMIADATQQGAERTGLSLTKGLKFPAPEGSAKAQHHRKRYDGVLDQFTKMLMNSGKKARAEKVSLPITFYVRLYH